MKCRKCDKEATVFGDVHDNITDKRIRVWTCEEHIPDTLDKLIEML